MKLFDLVRQCEGDENTLFEVSHSEYEEWEMIDVVHYDSPFLRPFYDCEITCLTAVREDTFRFCLINKEDA